MNQMPTRTAEIAEYLNRETDLRCKATVKNYMGRVVVRAFMSGGRRIPMPRSATAYFNCNVFRNLVQPPKSFDSHRALLRCFVVESEFNASIEIAEVAIARALAKHFGKKPQYQT